MQGSQKKSPQSVMSGVNKLKNMEEYENSGGGKTECLGAGAGKEFRFTSHIFMFCLGLKDKNSPCLAISIDGSNSSELRPVNQCCAF